MTARGDLRWVEVGVAGRALPGEGASGDRAVIKAFPGGVLLGALPDARYEVGTVELGSGDCVLAYSDGLSETFSRDGELYGEERVRAVLSRLRGLAADELLRALEAGLAQGGETADEHAAAERGDHPIASRRPAPWAWQIATASASARSAQRWASPSSYRRRSPGRSAGPRTYGKTGSSKEFPAP